MSYTIVRYRPAEDRREENQRLVAAVFEQLAEVRPPGLRYATFRLADGTFVHVADVEGENPLPGLSAFVAFTRELRDRCAPGEGPSPQAATLVGSYGLLEP